MVRLLYLLLALFLTAPVLGDSADLRGDLEQARSAWQLIDDGALVIDVRSEGEFASGHLAGAQRIPFDDTDALQAAIGEDRERPVVLYCGSGRRVGLAIEALEARGYEELFNATGLDALQAARPSVTLAPPADESDSACRGSC